MSEVLQRPVEQAIHVAVGAVVRPREEQHLHVHGGDDREELVGRVTAGLLLPEQVRELDELVDLPRALLLAQALPVRSELAAVELPPLDSAFLEVANVRGRGAREDVEAQAAQLKLARRGTEDLACLLEHLVDEGARLVVHEPPAPAALVATRLEEA